MFLFSALGFRISGFKVWDFWVGFLVLEFLNSYVSGFRVLASRV